MQLFEELQRRNVFRVAIGYAVSSWLLIQVADVALESFGAPEWVMRTIILVLALGFPVVVFFSWAYEVTTEGIKRESEVDRSQSITHVTGRKLDRAIIAVLAVALCYFAIDKYLVDEDVVQDTLIETVAEEADKSVAVLPFVNMSGDESSTYFSDGLADTVLHMLAQVADLRVAARTSSFQFRDQAMDIGEIGRQLNVASVLEGSVQKSGDKIRVTAQLIDVSNGFHLWSGNFDRDLNDVFAIQDEIASEVVAALKLSLLGESADSLTHDRTENLDAYTEFLLAVDKLNAISSENLASAVSHLQKAIELDSEYARAYSTLGRAYLAMARWGSMGNEQAISASRDAASRALDIDPASSEALAVLGLAATRDRDLDLAGELLGKAISIGPNDAVALDAYGRYLQVANRPEESITVYRQLMHLDPLSEDASFGLASALASLARHDEARDVTENFLLIQPDSERAQDMVFNVDFVQGNFAAALVKMKERVEGNPDDPDPEGQAIIGIMYLALDMPTEASQWFDRADERDPQHAISRAAPLILDYYLQQVDEDSFRLARELLEARIDRRIGSRFIALIVLTEYGAATDRHGLVLDTLDNLYPHLFNEPPTDLDKDTQGAFFVARALLESGDTERGRHLLKGLDELRAASRAAYGTGLADVVYSNELGDKEAAVARFAEYAERPLRGLYDKIMFTHSSGYELLRDEPEFIDYLDQLNQHAAEQRELLQAMNE